MAVMHTLRGRGVLGTSAGETEVGYRIVVRRRGEHHEISGFVSSTAPALLEVLKDASPVLRLQGGIEFPITLTRLNMAHGAAEISASGSISGL